MAMDLHKAGIAHGDLQHGNIIVSPNGSLRLVDYDSVFVPSLRGEHRITSGLVSYQHPCRKKQAGSTTEKDDYFSELVIYLSLIAISEDIGLWKPANERDDNALLFSANDFDSITESPLFKRLRTLKNNLLQVLLNELEAVLSQEDDSNLMPLERILGISYCEQPASMSIDEHDLESLIGPLKEKPKIKPQPKSIPIIFDEDEAKRKYSNNK